MIYSSVVLHASISAKQEVCDDRIFEIWDTAKYQGQDKTQRILDKCHFSSEIAKDVITILQMNFLVNKKQYQDVLQLSEGIYKRFNNYYKARDTSFQKLLTTNQISRLYLHMLELVGGSYLGLKEYENALQVFNQYEKDAVQVPYRVLHDMCYTYYGQKNYSTAKTYCISAYHHAQDADKKLSASYNVAAILAKQGDINASIKWLKVPLLMQTQKFIKMINADSDFNSIRLNPTFQTFLEAYKYSNYTIDSETREH